MALTEKERLQRVIAESGEPYDTTREEGVTAEIPPDRTRQFISTGLSRTPVTAVGDDFMYMEQVKIVSRKILRDRFGWAYNLLDSMWMQVREPLLDADEKVRVGPDGRPRWKLDEHGNPVEDWSLLDPRMRGSFLMSMATHMFEWEQVRGEMWLDALNAKGRWEEEFAGAFHALPGLNITKPTIDDKTQAGHLNSIEYRYRAIFYSGLSRQADGLVKSLYAIQDVLKRTAID